MFDYKENGPTLRYNPNIRMNYSDRQGNIDSNVTPDIEEYIETPYYVVNDSQNESKTVEKTTDDTVIYNTNSEKYSEPINMPVKKSQQQAKSQPKPKKQAKYQCNFNKLKNLAKSDAPQLAGKVLEETTCNPISGASVCLFRKFLNCDDQLVGTVTTDANGFYTFTNVTAGMYVIKIIAQGYTTKCICIAMLKNLTPLELTTTLKKDNITTSSNSCIFGIINDANKKPMCNTKVVLSKFNADNTCTNVASTTTDTCGKYTFKNVSNGNYKVSANNVEVSSVSIDGSCKRVQIYNN